MKVKLKTKNSIKHNSWAVFLEPEDSISWYKSNNSSHMIIWFGELD